MRKLIPFLFAISVAAFAVAQHEGDKPSFKRNNVVGVDGKSTVTQADAFAVFTQARKAIVAARIAKLTTKPTIAKSGQPVSRDQIILEMMKILNESKTAVKFVPKPVKFDPAVFKTGSAGAKAALAKLVKWGMVAPVGVLATGPKATLSIDDFGDALGFFLSRYSDVTHMPSTKWSPFLQPID